MSQSRGSVWFFAIFGLVVACVRLGSLREVLIERLGAADWLILAMLMAAPLAGVWSHLKNAQDLSEKTINTGLRLGLGGYVPLWFAFTVTERMMKG